MSKYTIAVLVSKVERIEVEAENEDAALIAAEDAAADKYDHNEWYIESDEERSAELNDHWNNKDDIDEEEE